MVMLTGHKNPRRFPVDLDNNLRTLYERKV